MKKNLFVFTLFVAAFGLTSCSSDDDFSYVGEFSEANIKEDLVGTWHVVKYYNYAIGLGEMDIDAGEITVAFTREGEMNVINKRGEELSPFVTGTHKYRFVDIERSILTGKSKNVLSFDSDFTFYGYSFKEGMFMLSVEAIDGSGWALKKLAK